MVWAQVQGWIFQKKPSSWKRTDRMMGQEYSMDLSDGANESLLLSLIDSSPKKCLLGLISVKSSQRCCREELSDQDGLISIDLTQPVQKQSREDHPSVQDNALGQNFFLKSLKEAVSDGGDRENQ